VTEPLLYMGSVTFFAFRVYPIRMTTTCRRGSPGLG